MRLECEATMLVCHSLEAKHILVWYSGRNQTHLRHRVDAQRCKPLCLTKRMVAGIKKPFISHIIQGVYECLLLRNALLCPVLRRRK